ncbi:unnamed protein product [Prorocentrum cordatum]|uniref:Uncharacterized protein n=1 Tax=Prorocentrum cordatum TaxID=2364126 RepID=A0ABN9TKX3_9DINO|nr:unnamed protein product [Polarella glacialis]
MREAGGLTRWSLMLFPSSTSATRSKTGEADVAAVMDSPRMAWLSHVFSHLSKGPRDERLFPWYYSEFYQMPVQAAAALDFKMAPYQGVDECMKRSRWTAAKSVARREKAGRLNDAWRELMAAQQARAFDCERQFEECLARVRRLLAPAMRTPRAEGADHLAEAATVLQAAWRGRAARARASAETLRQREERLQAQDLTASGGARRLSRESVGSCRLSVSDMVTWEPGDEAEIGEGCVHTPASSEFSENPSSPGLDDSKDRRKQRRSRISESQGYLR